MKSVVSSKKIALLGNCLTAEIRPYMSSITPGDVLKAPGIGGYGFIDLAVELIKRDINLLIVTLDPHLEEKRMIRTEGKITYAVLRQRKRRVLRDFFRDEVQSIVDFLSEEKPDLVHSHWSGPFALAAMRSGLPALFTMHDNSWDIIRYGGISYIPLHLIAMRVYKKAKFLTAPAPNVVKFAESRCAQPVEFIPNPIMSKNLDDYPGQNRDVNMIISVLNWNNLKNPKCAIKAFNLFLKSHPSAKMHLFGENLGKGEDGERWARRNSLQDNIVFHGKTTNDEVREYLKRGAILLHTSRTEACNMAVIQAMALGLAVIAGKNAGGTPYFLENGECGILCNIEDARDICRALCRLTEDEILLKKISASARSKALRMFNPDSVIPQYFQMYDRVLGQKFIHNDN
jgi:L-malate glycosyltransferase